MLTLQALCSIEVCENEADRIDRSFNYSYLIFAFPVHDVWSGHGERKVLPGHRPDN